MIERHCLRTMILACVMAMPSISLAEPVGYALDGDTIVMLSGETVRVENVDTPELSCECPSECRRALAAFSFTRDAVAGGVTVHRRMTRDGRLSPDRYGRTIGRVELPDGRDLGELLIARGLGRPWEGRRRSWCP